MKVVEKEVGQLVSLTEYGVIAITEPGLLEAVSAGGLFEAEVKANAVCGGSTVNAPCYGSNFECTASPNVACGSNTVCGEADSPV